jgi:hypothetical protein
VIPTEQIAKSAFTPKVGLFAALYALLNVRGTSAPKIAQGTRVPTRAPLLLTGLVTLCSLAVAALLATAAPALAACPNEEFRTGPSANLPDCRAYELVTPPFKEGSRAGISTKGVPASGFASVSTSGSRVDLSSFGNFGDAVNGEGLNEYQLTRTELGWTESSLELPEPQFAEEEPVATTPELEETLFRARGSEQSLEAKVLWLREANGALREVGPTEPPADTQGPTGPAGQGSLNSGKGGRYAGASSDLSHIFVAVESSADWWPGDEAYGAAGGTLYEYIVGRGGPPVPVGVEPDGAPCAANGTAGISADGSTVLFTCAGQVFARIDNGEAGARTVAISEPSAGDCSACDTSAGVRANAGVEAMSPDGSKVFFTTTQPLLGGDTSANIYEYDFDAPQASAEDPDGRLVHVSSGDWGLGGAQVQEAKVSEDDSHVYFMATGKLEGVKNSQGKEAVEGVWNLYVYERDAQFPAGRISLIVTTPGETEGELDEQVTPDGQFMVFQTSDDITPGDTSKTAQVFEYDAQTGELVRCSIGQDGFNDNGNTGTFPAAFGDGLGVSDNGEYVAFQSADGLTPGALNGLTVPEPEYHGLIELVQLQNVYEYHDGNVYLISDGQDTTTVQTSFSSVELEGMSPSGENIFFRTDDRLVPQDTDTDLDLYDARVDGGFPAPLSLLPSCQGDSCQGPLTGAPVLLSPSSEFQAGGNPPSSETPVPAVKPKPKAKACKKGYVKKDGKCVKKPKAKKAKAKKASNDRRDGQ